VTTITAGVLSVKTIYWPLAHTPGKQVQGYLDSCLMLLFVVGVIIVVFEAARRCWATSHGAAIPEEAFGSPETASVNMSCC